MTEPLDPAEAARRQKTNDLLRAVQVLIEAHGASYLRDLIRTEMVEAIADTVAVESSVETLRETLRLRGMTDDQIEETVVNARRDLQAMNQPDSAQLEDICTMSIKEGMPLIVLGWANALHGAASESNGIAWLRLSMLGDDMLPKDDQDATDVFDSHFPPFGVIDPDMGRHILRLVRAALPPGKVIPDDMAAALDAAWGIVIVP